MMRRKRQCFLIVITVIFITTVGLTLDLLITVWSKNFIRSYLEELGVSTNSSRVLLSKFNKPITRASEFLDSSVHVTVEVDWAKAAMRTLSAKQIIDYLLWTNQSSCQIAQYFGGQMVASADGLSVALDGQKAVCLDSPIAPSPNKCLVYSFGISNEWSFDDAMELYGCDVFSFDPSMNVSNYNRTESIHFYQMALDDVDKDVWNKNITVPSRTLSSIYNMLNPLHGGDSSIIDYLKMDIEATEWRVLPQIIESGMMDKVRQLAVEIHLDFDKSLSIYRQQARILQLLENYGMVRFDSKKNMFTVVDFTQVQNLAAAVDYEIAWYNRKLLRV